MQNVGSQTSTACKDNKRCKIIELIITNLFAQKWTIIDRLKPSSGMSQTARGHKVVFGDTESDIDARPSSKMTWAHARPVVYWMTQCVFAVLHTRRTHTLFLVKHLCLIDNWGIWPRILAIFISSCCIIYFYILL